MSNMSVRHTMDRIKGATSSSPIAVFRCNEKDKVNAVFAATVKTRQMIADKDPDFIGIYDASMNFLEIERTLRQNVF